MLIKLTGLSLAVFIFLSPAAYSDLNLPPLSAQAYSSSSQSQNVPVSTLLWRTPIFMAANQYLSVIIHEEAHDLAARLMGQEVERVEIGFLGGQVVLKDWQRMNDLQRSIVYLSGPIANRLSATLINSYLDTNERSIDEGWRSFLGSAYLMNRGNFAYYIFRSSVAAIFFGDFVSDWGNFAYQISGNNITVAGILMGSFCVLEAIDLYASRTEISKNFDRMVGRFPNTASVGSASAQTSSFSVLPYNDGFIAIQQFPF